MIVVLGGGPAGRMAAIRLASAKKPVTLVEPKGVSQGIGGQCLHFGCMPVCALNDIARMIGQARRFRERGMTDAVPSFNFAKVMEETLAVQQKIAGILDHETREAGVNVVYGKAGRVDGRRVFVGDEEIEAEAIIIATGSRPNIPKSPGIDLTGGLDAAHALGLRETAGEPCDRWRERDGRQSSRTSLPRSGVMSRSLHGAVF